MKTMSTAVLAASLEIDVYRLDLARLISGYIGETEKNLNALLEQAGASDALLFFDESGALFGEPALAPPGRSLEMREVTSRLQVYGGVVLLPDRVEAGLRAPFLRFAIDRHTLIERLTRPSEGSADASGTRTRQTRP
jgi:hypothetical protein